MYDNDAHGSGHRGRRRKGVRRACLLAAALACLALVAAACSSPPKTGTGAGPGGRSARHSELAFSQCMRAHGISAFPDPNSQGGIDLGSGPGGTGINPKSPQFKAANRACRSLLPTHTLSPAQQAEAKAQGLKYSRCMRAHGISDFPDPNSQGAIQIQANAGSGLDPHNPRFQAANRACQHDLPGGGKGGSFGTNTSGGPGGGS